MTYDPAKTDDFILRAHLPAIMMGKALINTWIRTLDEALDGGLSKAQCDLIDIWVATALEDRITQSEIDGLICDLVDKRRREREQVAKELSAEWRRDYEKTHPPGANFACGGGWHD